MAVFKNLWRSRHFKEDIIHVTGDIHYSVFSFPREKTLLTIHDCCFLENAKGFKKWILKKIWLDWPVKYVTKITTISEKSKKEIIAYTGCPEQKIEVIPNPLQEGFKYKTRQINSSCPNILFIGTTPNKNLLGTIEALKNIKCQLTIIGVLSMVQIRALTTSGISYVNYFGLTVEEVINCYETCDFLLFPSFYEGFGLPIIEAQAIGRVVITSNIEPMKSIAGEGACLVDPNNIESIAHGVKKIMGNEGYRSKLISKGLENIKKYEASAVADQYIELYQQMLNN